MYLQKSNNKKNLGEKILSVGVLKAKDENGRIRIRIHNTATNTGM
jgi:hypothetical protein